MYDFKITDGLVFDGNGGDGVKTNIAIKNGLIIEIGDCVGEASKTISAAVSYTHLTLPTILPV